MNVFSNEHNLGRNEETASSTTYKDTCKRSSEIKDEANNNQSNVTMVESSHIKNGDRNNKAEKKLFECEQ